MPPRPLPLLFAASFFILSGQGTPPAATRPLKIGVVDTEKIIMSSALGKKALAELKQLQEKVEAEFKPRIEEVTALQKKLMESDRLKSLEESRKLGEEYETKGRALQRDQEKVTAEVTKKRDDSLAAIEQKVMPIINQMAKEFGYTLIFRKFESGLLFADDAVDISDEVIKRLDAAQAGK